LQACNKLSFLCFVVTSKLCLSWHGCYQVLLAVLSFASYSWMGEDSSTSYLSLWICSMFSFVTILTVCLCA
jgi:hypothetical protein